MKDLVVWGWFWCGISDKDRKTAFEFASLSGVKMLAFGEGNLGFVLDFNAVSLFDIKLAGFASAFFVSRGLIALF